MKKGKTDIFADKKYRESKIVEYLKGGAIVLGGAVAGLGAIFSGPIVGGVAGAIYSLFTKDSNVYESMAIGAGIGTCLEMMAVPFLIMNAHQKMYHSDEL